MRMKSFKEFKDLQAERVNWLHLDWMSQMKNVLIEITLNILMAAKSFQNYKLHVQQYKDSSVDQISELFIRHYKTTIVGVLSGNSKG